MPEPGEEIMFTAATPFEASHNLFSAAMASFLARTLVSREIVLAPP